MGPAHGDPGGDSSQCARLKDGRYRDGQETGWLTGPPRQLAGSEGREGNPQAQPP